MSKGCVGTYGVDHVEFVVGVEVVESNGIEVLGDDQGH